MIGPGDFFMRGMGILLAIPSWLGFWMVGFSLGGLWFDLGIIVSTLILMDWAVEWLRYQ